MPAPSDQRLLVLHALRLKGFAEAEAAAELAQLPIGEVEASLGALEADGLVLHREGRLSGWSLTPAGRTEQERLLAAELDDAGVRSTVDDSYRHFLALNGDLLEVCTAWQMRGDALNDHSDPDYDSGVVAELAELHGRLLPVLDELEPTLGRFGGYRERFGQALARVQAGEPEFFTKPLIDSYHTIWFELHEDLLSSLGIERSKEPTS